MRNQVLLLRVWRCVFINAYAIIPQIFLRTKINRLNEKWRAHTIYAKQKNIHRTRAFDTSITLFTRP